LEEVTHALPEGLAVADAEELAELLGEPVAGAVVVLEEPVAGAVVVLEEPVAGAVVVLEEPVAGAVVVLEEPVAGAVEVLEEPAGGAVVEPAGEWPCDEPGQDDDGNRAGQWADAELAGHLAAAATVTWVSVPHARQA
jgi:hypothetical protein